MKNLPGLALPASILLVATTLNVSAITSEAPSVVITVHDVVPPNGAGVNQNGEGHRYEVPLVQTEKGWAIDQWTVEEPGQFSISLGGELNPDPSITYALGVVDFGLPSVFGFFFFTPIVATGPGVTVDGSIVGGLTDFGGDGVTLTAMAGGGPTTQISELSAPVTPMGVDVGTSLAVGPGPAGSLYGYGPFAAGPIPGPAGGPWTGLSATTIFGLSGGSDGAALTGFAQVVAAPVPDGAPGWAGLAVIAGLFAASRFYSRKEVRS